MITKDKAAVCFKCDGLEFVEKTDGGGYPIYTLDFVCGKCCDPITGGTMKCEDVNKTGTCENYKFFEEWEERSPVRRIYGSWQCVDTFWKTYKLGEKWKNRKYQPEK